MENTKDQSADIAGVLESVQAIKEIIVSFDARMKLVELQLDTVKDLQEDLLTFMKTHRRSLGLDAEHVMSMESVGNESPSVEIQEGGREFNLNDVYSSARELRADAERKPSKWVKSPYANEKTRKVFLVGPFKVGRPASIEDLSLIKYLFEADMNDCAVVVSSTNVYIICVDLRSLAPDQKIELGVRQMHLVAPMEKHFSLLYALLRDHIADNVDYKVLVFCTTAWVTRLVSEFLGELKLNVREIHSRKAQNYRTRVSNEFRKSKGLILVTSDVSARGVDYPDVTLVIQVGLPAGREQYIHRLGRTGRKGKEGQGILPQAPWEEFFLSTMKDFLPKIILGKMGLKNVPGLRSS